MHIVFCHSSNAVAVHSSMYGDIKGTQFMEINCGGRENRLTKCQHELVNNAYWSAADSIGVICSNRKREYRTRSLLLLVPWLYPA